MKSRWTPGNAIRLLENGEAFFPRVFEAIRAARHEVILETFIWFDDTVGTLLQQALLQAAANGAQVDVLVDGFGTADLSPAFLGVLAAAGVRVRSYDPAERLMGVRVNPLHRMHRKLVVIDGRTAFVGGINFGEDQLAEASPQGKQDYAVEIAGPLVDVIRQFALKALRGDGPPTHRPPALPPCPPAGTAQALFVTRDNARHTTDIERHYRAAVRSARHRVLIANAYFFPGYRLLRAMRRAARRGVKVQLILQGNPDMPIVRTAASLLYEHLQRDGVQIYEYTRRPLHGKVAVVDDDWSTVGSSNLDPLSLSLNLEANVVIRDAEFAALLSAHLEGLIAESCGEVIAAPTKSWGWWSNLRSAAVFHFLRHFPAWANRLPRRTVRLEPACLPDAPGDARDVR